MKGDNQFTIAFPELFLRVTLPEGPWIRGTPWKRTLSITFLKVFFQTRLKDLHLGDRAIGRCEPTRRFADVPIAANAESVEHQSFIPILRPMARQSPP
jgi:hypothetical protein